MLSTPGAVRGDSTRIPIRGETDPDIERGPINLLLFEIDLRRDGVEVILVQAETHRLADFIAGEILQLDGLLGEVLAGSQIHAANSPQGKSVIS